MFMRVYVYIYSHVYVNMHIYIYIHCIYIYMYIHCPLPHQARLFVLSCVVALQLKTFSDADIRVTLTVSDPESSS